MHLYLLKKYLWPIFSGAFLFFINRGLEIKASEHACGISGPITLLINLIGFNFVWLYLLIPLVFWSRIKLGRHTLKELVIGTFIGTGSTLVAMSFFLE